MCRERQECIQEGRLRPKSSWIVFPPLFRFTPVGAASHLARSTQKKRKRAVLFAAALHERGQADGPGERSRPSDPDLPSEGSAYPWSTTAQTYSKENSRSKNLLIFKLHTTLSRVTKAWTIQGPSPLGCESSLFLAHPPCICHLPIGHLKANSVIRVPVVRPHSLCSWNPCLAA